MSVLRVPLTAALASAALGVGLAHMRPETFETAVSAVQQSLHVNVGGLASRDHAVSASHPEPIRSPADPWRVDIEPNAFGQFLVDMTINGRNLDAMVDTGASYVALSYEAAASIGLHPSPAEFKYVMQTANGSARAAGTVIPHIQIGRIEARDVEAVISEPGALTAHNLLGMSFLRKLSGFQVESGRLVLKQ